MDTLIHRLDLDHPWRTATLVAAGIAAVELVLLIVFGLVLVGRSISPHAGYAATPAAAAATPKAVRHVAAARKKHHRARVVAHLPRSKVGVIILNGNGIHGAAASAASLVSARGYKVRQVGNAQRTGYPTWRLMYRPRLAGEAKRFAHDLGMSAATVGPLDGMRPAQLHGAKLVLILGASKV